jgi:hypothetical protein
MTTLPSRKDQNCWTGRDIGTDTTLPEFKPYPLLFLADGLGEVVNLSSSLVK